MNRGRPAPMVEPDPQSRRALEAWAGDESTPSELSLRARIVILSASGKTNVSIARHLNVTRETVAKWRARYCDRGLGGLLDEPRPGAPSALKAADVDRVRSKAEESPVEGNIWTTRQLAKELDLTQTAVSRILRAFSLEPHVAYPRHLPRRGLLQERVVNVAGLYVDPPLRALALTYDPRIPKSESTPSQAEPIEGHEAVAELDQHARKASRHGTGAVRWEPFLAYLGDLEVRIPAGCTVQLLLAGYTALKTLRITRWLEEHRRIETHPVPTSGTWLELVAKWAALYEPEEEYRGPQGASIVAESPGAGSSPEFQTAIRAYLASGTLGEPFRWLGPVAGSLARAASG